jgi:hypothetical protein
MRSVQGIHGPRERQGRAGVQVREVRDDRGAELMPLPFAGPVTFRYITPHATLAEAEAWCAANGLTPCVLERGPDGLIRGTCTPEVVHDGGAAPTSHLPGV